MEFKEKYQSLADLANSYMDNEIQENEGLEKTIYSAMRYSILAGGKRLRPVLGLAVAELFDSPPGPVLPYACAVELIHTYSLIHDDLPAMDNDDFRRGKATNHKVFGDAVAVLAGDGLLNHAFESMLKYTLSSAQTREDYKKKVNAMQLIAQSSGVKGMIAGQVIDIESEGKKLSPHALKYMHKCKTGALIRASVIAPAILCDATQDQIKSLGDYADNIGLAFQIKDDIMDVESSLEVMGKPQGSDAELGKSTYVTIFGAEESKKMLFEITNNAIDSLSIFGTKSEFLIGIAKYLANRNN